NGNLQFQPEANNAGTHCHGSPLVLSDVNGDGKPDLWTQMSSVFNNYSMGLMLGNGDGTFQPLLSYSVGGYVAAVADLNGDGLPDIVALNPYYGTLVVQLQLPPPPPSPAGAGSGSGSSGGGDFGVFSLMFIGILVYRRKSHVSRLANKKMKALAPDFSS
ncbi:MAG: VCBS repeat-containing protein, partial [Gammaproteobacteria bacterium]|nr:VCBS repeat-containing protein [Gammaproteobacteria bacterium]